MSSSSRYYPTIYKERVVDYYTDHYPKYSFRQVATLFKIEGGHKTVSRWYNQRHSLETKSRSGRPPKLTMKQMNQYITKTIREKNQSALSVHYTDLMSDIKNQIDGNVSLRIIQRYGHDRLGIKMKKTSKRTEQECKFIHTKYQTKHSNFYF